MWKSLLLILFIVVSCNTATKVPVNPTAVTSDSSGIPFHPLNKPGDLDILVEDIGNARIVLLGESTHGTHEFYKWRAEISKRLITEKGFDFIAIEGDWVDTYRVNELIKGPLTDSATILSTLKKYDRWPSSMWGNYEMADFVKWLNQDNQGKVAGDKTGLFGLDLYSFWEWSFERLPVRDLEIEKQAFAIRQGFDSMQNDALRYSAAFKRSKLDLSFLTRKFYDLVMKDEKLNMLDANHFLVKQYAHLALEGEKYFRTLVEGKVESWNTREYYMTNTIRRLLDFHGSKSKAIIWVHNGHAGDAGYSQMAEGGYKSIGSLLKEEMNQAIYTVCFGMNKGTVYAGYSWNAPLLEIAVPAARQGSWENLFHEQNPMNRIVLSREMKNHKILSQWLPFRSIGAAYSNNAIYGTAVMPKRFDAIVYIDSTTAIRPLIF